MKTNNILNEFKSLFVDLVLVLFINYVLLCLFNLLLYFATNEYTVKSNFLFYLLDYRRIFNLLVSFFVNNIYQVFLCLFFLKKIAIKVFFWRISIRNNYILVFLSLIYYSVSFIYLFIYFKHHISFNILTFLLFCIYLIVLLFKLNSEV